MTNELRTGAARDTRVAALLAVVVATAIVAGCGGSSAPGTPTSPAEGASPVLGPTTTAPTTPPTAVAANPVSSPAESMASPAAPPTVVHSVSVPDLPSDIPPIVTLGHLVIHATGSTPGSGLAVADLLAGTETAIKVPFAAGERPISVVSDATWLAVVALRRLGPPPAETGGTPCSGDSSQPVAWRLLVAPIDATATPTSPFRVLAQGESQRVFRPAGQAIYCAGPTPPVLALAGGRLAYAVDDPAAGAFGSRIVIRSLATRAIERTIVRSEEVVYLALSATAVAWSESANDPQTGVAVPWGVLYADLQDGTPSQVPLGALVAGHSGPPQVALDGDAVVLAGPSASQVWIVERSVESNVSLLNPPDTPAGCLLGGVGEGAVLLWCAQPGATSGPWTLAELWTARTGTRALDLADTALSLNYAIGGGWIAWPSLDLDGHRGIAGVPLAALGA